MQEPKKNLLKLNPFAPDFKCEDTKTNETDSNFIQWVTPKPKPYVPNQEIKKIEIHTVKHCLDHVEDFKIAARVKEYTNYYFPVLFQGLRCQIHVPLMTVLFGLLQYKDPPRTKDIKNIKPKYSIHLCMDDSTEDIYNFHCLIDYLDMIAKNHKNTLRPEDIGMKINDPNFNQFKLYSSLRQNRKDLSKPVALRIKIPSKENVLFCQLYNGEELMPQDIQTFEKFVHHNTKAKCIIEVNPIWYGTYTGDLQYGISFKLIALKIERPKIEFK